MEANSSPIGSITVDFIEKECHINIPIPLPNNTCIDDWVRVLCSSEQGKYLDPNEAKAKMSKFIREETQKWEDARDDKIVLEALNRSSSDYTLKIRPRKRVRDGQPSFAEKFTFVVNKCSSENLLTLMQMEVSMKKEMSDMIRARDWEIEELSKKCERILDEDQDNDIHPHKISVLNEKLRLVFSTYSLQVAKLSDEQRARYKKAVDSLYSHGSIPAELLENVDLDANVSVGPLNEDSNSNMFGVDESFTIYIGAQLKSMHNACLLTLDTMTDLCEMRQHDWTVSSRLEMASKLYGRGLAALVLLVPRDPLFHMNSSSKFYKICEQSTELHFDSVGEQLKQVAKSTRNGNIWRADCLDNIPTEGISSTIYTCTDENRKVSASALRSDSTLALGDVYLTRHSNLHKIQVAFHLVVDELLQTAEISSRHACLNGLRNIIRLTANFGISSIHLPLLLIDKPDESTTIAWCVKRAEMVYKCVKGYLIEVCSGTNIESVTHYNVHFVLPAGLSPTIYTTITNMFPTIFHLVPSVSITMRKNGSL